MLISCPLNDIVIQLLIDSCRKSVLCLYLVIISSLHNNLVDNSACRGAMFVVRIQSKIYSKSSDKNNNNMSIRS